MTPMATTTIPTLGPKTMATVMAAATTVVVGIAAQAKKTFPLRKISHKSVRGGGLSLVLSMNRT